MTGKTTLTALFMVVFSAVASGVLAEPLPPPTGPIILTVEGQISHTNRKGKAVFDRQMLEEIGMQRTQTATPWTTGTKVYEGPLGRALLQRVGAKGDTLEVVAINNYAAQIPVQDFNDYDVILALKENGKYMRVRDKGPTFILYPYDSDERLRNEVIYGRSVWQIKTIRIK